MTNKQILKGAIEKALKNGWDPGYSFEGVRWAKDDEGNPTIHWPEEVKQQQTRDIIFDHGFAKCFWGEEDFTTQSESMKEMGMIGGTMWVGNWKFHLQRLVLQENSLEYLEKFL